MGSYSKDAIQEIIKYNEEISQQIKNICAPFQKYFNINLIAFRRFYSNGSLLYLFNNAAWMNFSFENECWSSTSFYDRVKNLSCGSTLNYLWPDKPSIDDKVYSALYEHNLWNGAIVYKKYADCLETFAFASSKEDTGARNIYFLEADIMEHFICYFKSKIFPVVYPVEKNILIPFRLNELKYTDNYEEKKKLLFDETDTKNFYLRTNGRDIKLTKRERDCLALLSAGNKTKGIARLLELSSRTVEFYLNNIMQKTNYNKLQLVQLYQQNYQSYKGEF